MPGEVCVSVCVWCGLGEWLEHDDAAPTQRGASASSGVCCLHTAVHCTNHWHQACSCRRAAQSSAVAGCVGGHGARHAPFLCALLLWLCEVWFLDLAIAAKRRAARTGAQSAKFVGRQHLSLSRTHAVFWPAVARSAQAMVRRTSMHRLFIKSAISGIRTRVESLEGTYTNHCTNIASCSALLSIIRQISVVVTSQSI